MKKIFSALVFAWIFISSTYAGDYASTTSSYTTIKDDSLNFKAELINGDVETSWEVYNWEDSFKYYKVVRSNKYDDPVYPDHGYIKAITDVNYTKHVDENPFAGTSYYRVCAITAEMNRYCSNVVKVYNEKPVACTMEYAPVCGYKDGVYKTYGNKCMLDAAGAYKKYYGECKTETQPCTKEYIPVCWYKDGNYKTYSNKCMMENDGAIKKFEGKCSDQTSYSDGGYGLTTYQKTKSKLIINKFLTRLEKTDYSNAKKIDIVDGIIEKLEDLSKEKSKKMMAMIQYLISLLEQAKDKYEETDFSDIENIFDFE